jgi:hypothetical protein
MTKVFVNIGLSLDGYMAPEGMTYYFINDEPERALDLARESAT